MNKYDEDLYDNPFFLCIQSQYQDLHQKIAASKWTICIPKHSVAAKLSSYSEEDVKDHILCPPDSTEEGKEGEDGSIFQTYSGKRVEVKGQKIATALGFSQHLEVDILFEETFHGEDNESYRAVCISGFLNKPPEAEQSPRPRASSRVTNYEQCMEVLWSHAGGQKTRDQLDKTLDLFCSSYARLEGANLRSIVDAANAQFTRAMQLLLKDSVVRRSARHNDNYMESLKVAVETYLMHAVHNKLFGVITACVASQDAELNKLTRNLAELQLPDMGIRKIFSANIPPAKRELANLNRYSTPLGRLFCIKRVVAILTRPLHQEDSSEEAVMTTDDFLPILIFLIIKSEIPNWTANLMFMKNFHFSKSSSDDEFGFYLASIEAALEHIRSGQLKDDVIRKEKLKYRGRAPEEFGGGKDEESADVGEHQSSVVEDFFVAVQGGLEDTVVALLQQPQRAVEEVYLQLCHPLCSCDRCERILAATRSDSNLVTAYTRDSRGYTALHIAAYYGQAQLIDVLVKHGALVSATDYLGLTPLHLACQRGFQNVLLLLLHFGGDVMAKDNDGNIPLHLCASNGHEDCVKALVFSEFPRQRMNINTTNDIGDTALHLAAKWGYESIVRILLENGADATKRNRKKQRAISLTHNPAIQSLLNDFSENPVSPAALPNLKVQSPSHTTRGASLRPSISSPRVMGSAELVGGTLEGLVGGPVETATLTEDPPPAQLLRNKERLYKAIVDGDLPLVKYYLGLDRSDQAEEEDDDLSDVEPVSPSAEMCHPLCLCPKCQGIQKARGRERRLLSVNTTSQTGYSLLHLAVLHQHADLVTFLLQQGANVNACNHRRLSPLHAACHLHNTQVCRILLEWDCQVDLRDAHGDTPLHTCCENGFLQGVEVLIEHKAGLDLRNSVGNTPVLTAVDRNHADIVRRLLAAGADPKLSNRHGQLPLQLCKSLEVKELVMGGLRVRERSPPSTPSKGAPPLAPPSGHIKELFAALGSDNLDTLKADIRNFRGRRSLRRTMTRDNSAPQLSSLAISHAIQTFDVGALRHVASVDRGQPLHMYALAIGDSSLAARSLTPSQPRRQSTASLEGVDNWMGPNPDIQGSTLLAPDGAVEGQSVTDWEDLSLGADSGLGSRDLTLTSVGGEGDSGRGASDSPVDSSTMSTLPDVEMDSLMGDQMESEVNGHSSDQN